MFENTEFFVGKDGHDVVYQTSDGNYSILSEDDADIIHYMYNRIRNDYPGAHTALKDIYGQAANFKFLIVRRFIKCNFSILDSNADVQGDGFFRLEHVHCPLRDECKHEGIICKPVYNSSLSKRELDIVKLIVEGLTDQKIGDRLFISPFTVNVHRKNILSKLGLHSKSQIVDWYHKNCKQ